jgi:hypothetical protein
MKQIALTVEKGPQNVAQHIFYSETNYFYLGKRSPKFLLHRYVILQ